MKSNIQFYTAPVRTFFIPFYFGFGMIIPFSDSVRTKDLDPHHCYNVLFFR